jgi:hypothetical protein
VQFDQGIEQCHATAAFITAAGVPADGPASAAVVYLDPQHAAVG